MRNLPEISQLFHFGVALTVLLYTPAINAQSKVNKPAWPALPAQDLDVTRARPLQDVFYMIEARLHGAIGYEQGSPEVTSMIVPGLRAGEMTQRVEHLHVHFGDGTTDPITAVQTALNAYDNGSEDHKFAMRTDGSLILVYPQSNPLSLRQISISIQQRTLDQIAHTIADSISQVAGREVKIWTGEFNDPTVFNFGAQNEAVSSVLARFTRLKGGIGGYWLVYHPTQDCYYLSLKFLTPPLQEIDEEYLRQTQALKK
jgi:hypothetical protein